MSEIDEVRTKLTTAIANGDVPGVLSCYRPDAVMVAPEARYEGRQQIEEYYRTQLEPFTAVLKISGTHDVGNVAVTEWTMEATHTGPLPLPDGSTLPPDGKQLTQRGVDVAVITDGLIGEHRLYYDQVELLAQLGLIPDGK